jgi:hypothetical protein
MYFFSIHFFSIYIDGSTPFSFIKNILQMFDMVPAKDIPEPAWFVDEIKDAKAKVLDAMSRLAVAKCVLSTAGSMPASSSGAPAGSMHALPEAENPLKALGFL